MAKIISDKMERHIEEVTGMTPKEIRESEFSPLTP